MLDKRAWQFVADSAANIARRNYTRRDKLDGAAKAYFALGGRGDSVAIIAAATAQQDQEGDRWDWLHNFALMMVDRSKSDES